MTTDSEFDAIKQVFWEHLSAEQRMSVLVSIGALPEAISQPLTQGIERLALHSARQRGKVDELRDAVCKYVNTQEQS